MSHPAQQVVDARKALLERAAHAEGSAWAAWWRVELRRQKRFQAGGWPGTLSEARIRVARRVAAELGPAFGATREELEVAARSAYAIARREWNDTCDPEGGDGEIAS
ncbi:MAG TPA: hypothetical protein VFU21_19605 [Kofleriaceae bacterium]|nr:hypothetical protein [Kofleriaceae bacterium]